MFDIAISFMEQFVQYIPFFIVFILVMNLINDLLK